MNLILKLEGTPYGLEVYLEHPLRVDVFDDTKDYRNLIVKQFRGEDAPYLAMEHLAELWGGGE